MHNRTNILLFRYFLFVMFGFVAAHAFGENVLSTPEFYWLLLLLIACRMEGFIDARAKYFHNRP